MQVPDNRPFGIVVIFVNVAMIVVGLLWIKYGQPLPRFR